MTRDKTTPQVCHWQRKDSAMKPTLDQAGKLLELVSQSGRTDEWVQEHLIGSGALSDLLAVENLRDMNRDEHRKFLGLNPLQPPLHAPEAPMDFSVYVDRSVSPIYPDWVKKVMHPELERMGPAEYDLSLVKLWLHPDQLNGVVNGNAIYKHLKQNVALADCLGLADLRAIQAKGIAVFRKLFAGKVVFGWKSVVQDRDVSGNLSVPYLYEDGDKVVLHWNWLDGGWRSNGPAVRFGK